MTIQMSLAEAKAKLSELVARAEAGEKVVIARYGKSVVSLNPKSRPGMGSGRRLGVWDHLAAAIPEDLFLAPDPDMESAVAVREVAPISPAK